MGRLLWVIVNTPDVDRMRAFYEGALGLRPSQAQLGWTAYPTLGATLALQGLREASAPEILTAFETRDLDARLATLAARGIAPLSGASDALAGRTVEFRDPEGNRVALIEPRGVRLDGQPPALSHAIVNAAHVGAMAMFYRDIVGLRVAGESPTWVEFDTGPTRFALHARDATDDLPLHAEQKVAFALTTDDLAGYVDAITEAGVALATTIQEESIGEFAEVEDPDGWLVVLRGPSSETPLEEQLAEGWMEDDVPHQVAIRKPAEHHAPLAPLSIKPAYHGSRAQEKKAEAKQLTRALHARLDEKAGVREPQVAPLPAVVAPAPAAPRPAATGRRMKSERESEVAKIRAEAAVARRRPVRAAVGPNPPVAKPAARKGTTPAKRGTSSKSAPRATPAKAARKAAPAKATAKSARPAAKKVSKAPAKKRSAGTRP